MEMLKKIFKPIAATITEIWKDSKALVVSLSSWWLNLQWARAIAFALTPFAVFLLIEIVTVNPLWEVPMGISGWIGGELILYKMFMR